MRSATKNKESDTEIARDIIAKQIMSMVEGIVIHHSSTKQNCKKIIMKQYDEVIDSYLTHLTKSHLSIGKS